MTGKKPKNGLHEQLEERILFDAAVDGSLEILEQQTNELAALTDASVDHVAINPATQLTEQSEAQHRNEIVFVDKGVEGFESIVAELVLNHQAEVVFLDREANGVEQIASVLSDRNELDAIHIISHGDQGELYLGNDVLDAESMQGEHADELAIIREALSDDGDLLIYGCEFSGGLTGKEATQLLSKLTGADVAASDDTTGAAELGGDWDLETAVGRVETETLAAMAWGGTLADTDGDGIDDANDIDDDNDGILDVLEAPMTTVPFSADGTFESLSGVASSDAYNSTVGAAGWSSGTGSADSWQNVTTAGSGIWGDLQMVCPHRRMAAFLSLPEIG